MAQVINTNILSLNTQNNLNKSQSAQARAIERLSSGMRINSAKDDAAGQAIANRFTTNVKGLTQAARNANDGISMAQTAEGAVNEINNNLQRIRELTVQAKNGSNSESDIKSLQEEVEQRLQEINRISAQTDFNGNKVLSKDGEMKIQIGALDNQTISLDFKKIDSSVLKVNEVDLSNRGQIGNQVKKLSDTATTKPEIKYTKDTTRTDEKLYKTGTAGEFVLEFDNASSTKEYYTVHESNFKSDGTVNIAGLTAATTKPAGTTTAITSGGVAIASTKQAAIKLDSGQELFQKLEADGSVATDKFLIKKDDQYFEVKRDDFDASTGAIKTASVSKLDPTKAITTDIHDEPLKALDEALKTVDSMRSTLGAVQNRMESTVTNLQNTVVSLSAARSRIQDADFATEVSNMTKGQTLQQAGMAVLAQANQTTQSVLSLLR
uniref:Flagellin n=1 Tax=Providencia stuartii TaxID=588 RepID=A0AAI9D9N0_PROST|nr:FliC/FljB family flagellin [Providencia stuartii]